MKRTSILLAQLEVSDCTAELYLNGVPIMRIAPPYFSRENAAVETIVVPGTNRLEVVVEPGSHPSVARTEFHELSFRPLSAIARLIRFDQEDVPATVENGTLLGQASYAWADGRPERQMFPVEVGTQIELTAANGRWRWQDAPPLVLDEALVAEARAVLDEVERAVRRHDDAAFFELTRDQLVEVQRAYPNDTEAALRAEITELLDHYAKSADPVLARDPAQQDFRLVAGDRMLQLVDRDYTASFKLREPSGREGTPYRLMLARFDGRLRIAR